MDSIFPISSSIAIVRKKFTASLLEGYSLPSTFHYALVMEKHMSHVTYAHVMKKHMSFGSYLDILFLCFIISFRQHHSAD